VRSLVVERRQSQEDRGDLLSMLLAARDSDGSALSDQDVCSEALTVLLAGHETTALMLSWAWYLLTQHPEVQEALAAQIEEQTGGRPVTTSDLPSLPLVQQVVNETLRLYPTAWMGDRLTDGQVELGGYDVPAGTPVLFSVYVTHRDARFFPEPDRFDPGRFSPERKGEVPSGAYLPFGGGVHVCIGNAFALLEGQLLLAAMAQRFRVHAVSQKRVRPSPSITLGMRDPFYVRLEART
jgi:cytochrome P450